jgi:hypothetical protein
VTADHGVVEQQNDDCADNRDEDAVKIDASHSYVANGVEEPATRDSPTIPNTMSITTP